MAQAKKAALGHHDERIIPKKQTHENLVLHCHKRYFLFETRQYTRFDLRKGAFNQPLQPKKRKDLSL